MQRAFQFDARQLLAADLLLVSDHPLPEQFLEEGELRQLRIAQTVVFPTMATVGSQSKLASLKAATPTYPLRGQLEVAQVKSANIVSAPGVAHSSPSVGQVWVEPAMLNSLGAHVGDVMTLGESHFIIGGVLTRELDRGAGFMNFAPRVMMSLEDLNATGLIGLGSRVTYRLLLSGSDESIAAYEKWASTYIESKNLHGVRIETLENAQPLMRKTLDRAERFLSLISLLTAMVAAVAIALSARRYALKQTDVYAVMKCLGASQSLILKWQLKTLVSLGILASVLGALVGYLAQECLLRLLGGLVMESLPSISAWPVIWSALLAWSLLLGFAGPPLFELVKVSPIRLVRKEFNGLSVKGLWVAIGSLGTCACLIAITAKDWKLAAWVGASFGGAIALFSLLAWATLFLLSRLKLQSFPYRFALKIQARQASFAIIQITALGIALMTLLMILLLRQDLLASWRGNLSPDAPNRFIINIQEDQKQGIANELTKSGLAKPEFYPMVRGRLIEINDRPVLLSHYQDDSARRLLDREFNLSYVEQLPPGNRITAGQWIHGDAPQVSLEVGIAKTLNLKLGDLMTFEVAGEKVSAPITSLRKLDWGSMRVNFFVIMPPKLLIDLPQSWITSFYQPSNLDGLDFQINQSFPNLTIVDVAASLQQIQDILDRLSSALGLLFAFTIMAAILVLISAMSATQDERFKNAALLKALGASKKMLANIVLTELLVTGLIAGALAGLAAGGAAWALGRFVLEIEFNAFAQSLGMGMALGSIACLAAGYQFLRKIQSTTAMECLREIA